MFSTPSPSGDLLPGTEVASQGLFTNLMLREYMTFASEAEVAAFCEFLGPLLTLDPRKRATAQEASQHPWLAITADEESTTAQD